MIDVLMRVIANRLLLVEYESEMIKVTESPQFTYNCSFLYNYVLSVQVRTGCLLNQLRFGPTRGVRLLTGHLHTQGRLSTCRRSRLCRHAGVAYSPLLGP